MPGRNGTGPLGQGAMTGGGRGWRRGANMKDELPPRPRGRGGAGLGRGNGAGGGGGHRFCYHASGLAGWQRARLAERGVGAQPAAVAEQEVAVVRRQMAALELALGDLRARIQELDERGPGTSEKAHE